MSKRHPIKFGLEPAPEDAEWEELANVWRFAEELGYDSLWTTDHIIPSVYGDKHRPVFEGWAALAGLAAVTSRAACGVLVTGNSYRNPALLAKIAATVDHISGGRMVMGMGASWLEAEHHMYDVPFYSNAERVHRMGEALQILKKMWTEHSTDFNGKYYQVRGAICEPKPLQKPHPPILVGSGGVQLGLRYVARYADAWNSGGPPEMFKEKIEILNRYCEEIGRDGEEIEKSVILQKFYLTNDPKQADEFMRRQHREVWPARELEDLRQGYLVGSLDDMRELVGRLVDTGITHLIIQVVQPYDYEGIERFYKEVALEFKGK